MRFKNWMTWIVPISLVLIFMANMTEPAAWAARDPAPLGQTVPTRTPTPGAEPPSATQPATPIPTVALTPTSIGAPALLPVAGGDWEEGLALVGVAGLGLLALAWTARRRTRRLS